MILAKYSLRERYACHPNPGKRVNPDRPFTLVLSGGGLKGLAHIGVLRALEEFYARFGVLGIFLSRFLPGLRAGVTPFAGVAGVSPARALVPAAAASALWYAFLAGAGYALADNWARARAFVEDANRMLGLVAVVATAFLLLWLWHRSRAKRPEADVEDERG